MGKIHTYEKFEDCQNTCRRTPRNGKNTILLEHRCTYERMCAEESFRENEVDLHLKKKEVVQKLAELSQYENDLEQREQELEELREELTKKEKHLIGWESEIKKIAGIVAEEKRRIQSLTDSIEKLEEEPSMDETPGELEESIPGEVENVPEEEEPPLEESEEQDVVVAEELLRNLFAGEEPIEEKPEKEEPPKKSPVKKVVKKKKKKKKFGLFK